MIWLKYPFNGGFLIGKKDGGKTPRPWVASIGGGIHTSLRPEDLDDD